jgi:hypothetical protein
MWRFLGSVLDGDDEEIEYHIRRVSTYGLLDI